MRTAVHLMYQLGKVYPKELLSVKLAQQGEVPDHIYTLRYWQVALSIIRLIICAKGQKSPWLLTVRALFILC